MSRSKQLRAVAVRSVVLVAALATTLAQLPACQCNAATGESSTTEGSCHCSSSSNPEAAGFSDAPASGCQMQFASTSCCESSEGDCSCDACCCTVDSQPIDPAVVSPIVSADDFLLSGPPACLVPVASIQPQRESRAAWQLARGSPLPAASQSLFCVWIN